MRNGNDSYNISIGRYGLGNITTNKYEVKMYYDYEDLKEMVVWAYNNEVGTYIVGDRYDEDIYDEENDKYIPIWKFVKICKENGYEG